MTSGIYQIRNKINKKIYIGSAINIVERWQRHVRLLNRNKHTNKHLQSAWNKYGSENFEFTILEECEKELLIEREQFYLDTLCPEYNICPTAGSQLGTKRTKETRLKMSLAKRNMPNETREKISLTGMGRIQSAETRAKIAASKLGHMVSQETRDKISETIRKERRRLMALSLNEIVYEQ